MIVKRKWRQRGWTEIPHGSYYWTKIYHVWFLFGVIPVYIKRELIKSVTNWENV